MKKCPYCAEEIQDEAIVCKHCGRDLAPKPEYKPAPIPAKKKSNGIRNIILILVGLLVVLCVILQLQPKSAPDPKSDAWYACRQFVEQRLKSPSSAKFETYSNGTVIDRGASTYEAIMEVDAENTFGAMIRSTFTCEVKKQSNGDWLLVDISEK